MILYAVFATIIFGLFPLVPVKPPTTTGDYLLPALCQRTEVLGTSGYY